jgi:hypothetical protein
MKFPCPRNNSPTPRRYHRATLSWLTFPLAGLLCACQLSQPTDLEQAQTDNSRLTKTFHAHLNHHDWQAVEGLCAETIRYRSRATRFAEVDESKAQFLAHYRSTLTSTRSGALEIRQLYSAGAYHVIVEGIASGEPPDRIPHCPFA